MLRQIGRFFMSQALGNLLLGLILILSAYTLYGNGQIIASLRRTEVSPVSTTYIGSDGQQHTVNSPTQTTATENVRVHKEYLKAAYCQFPPMTNPEWFHPETDCP